MADVIAFPAGGYRYLAGVFQYSAGVAADTVFEIEHAFGKTPEEARHAPFEYFAARAQQACAGRQ